MNKTPLKVWQNEMCLPSENVNQNNYSRLIFFVSGNDVKELIQESVKAREYAYCPYSKFKVGAAVRVASGTIYSGCNIENSAYPVSLCAERTALAKAISEGQTKISAVAVTAKLEASDKFTFPCGSCRQFIAEFATERDIPIYVAKPELNTIFVTSIKQILPHDFHF